MQGGLWGPAVSDIIQPGREPLPEFDAWVAKLDPKHWARYDLAACRLGWEAARAGLPTALVRVTDLLTPTERKIYSLLSSGGPQSKQSILTKAVGKQFAAVNLVPMHINRMKPKLAKFGMTIEFSDHEYQLTTPKVEK